MSPSQTVAQFFAWLNRRFNVHVPTAPPPYTSPWAAQLWDFPITWSGSPTVPFVADIDVPVWSLPTSSGGHIELLDPKIEVTLDVEDEFYL